MLVKKTSPSYSNRTSQNRMKEKQNMIRIGILGATRGLNFAFAAKNYALELKIAAVCDTYRPLLDKVKDQLPPRGFNPAFFADYGEMLE